MKSRRRPNCRLSAPRSMRWGSGYRLVHSRFLMPIFPNVPLNMIFVVGSLYHRRYALSGVVMTVRRETPVSRVRLLRKGLPLASGSSSKTTPFGQHAIHLAGAVPGAERRRCLPGNTESAEDREFGWA